MRKIKPFKFSLNASVFFSLLLLVFSQNAHALRLEPLSVKEREGAVIQYKIIIEKSDWVDPSESQLRDCSYAGYNPSKVAVYVVKSISSTAGFGNSATSQDLHFTYNGEITRTDLTILACGNGPVPGTQHDLAGSITLHEDDEEEPLENAFIELYSKKPGKGTVLVASSVISIIDAKTNSNECSFAELGIEGVVQTGSLSGSDCDESPRGSGFLADGFTFSGVQGDSITADVSWDGLDGYLYLQAPDGSIEAENDDSTGPKDSRISLDLGQTGDYILWLSSAEIGEQGDYEISLTVSQPVKGDWSFSQVEVSPQTLPLGGSLTFSLSGQREDPVDSLEEENAEITFLLSYDDVISLDDIELGTGSFCCSAGFDETVKRAVDAVAGNYWVGACFTNHDANADNNCSMATAVTLEDNSPCGGRGLSCGEVFIGTLDENSCAFGPLGAGHAARKFTISGLEGDIFWLNANWAQDGYLQLRDPQGVLLAENDNFTSAANSQIEFTLKQDGVHTVWASNFEAGAMGDFELSMDCDGGAGPDLVLDQPLLSQGEVVSGQAIKLSTMLFNTGDLPADSTSLHFLLSSDPDIDRSDAELGREGASALAANEALVHEFVLTAPVAPGQYWLGVCADPVAAESSVTNNCSPATPILVSASGECVVNKLSCGQPFSGELGSMDCTTSPRGPGFFAQVLEITAIADSSLVLRTRWADLGGSMHLENPDGELVAGGSVGEDERQSIVEYPVESGGTHRLWVSGIERSGQGSYEVEVLCGAPSAPDLVTDDITSNVTAIFSQGEIELSVLVRNQGSGTSEVSKAHFLLSSDPKISMSDEILHSMDVDTLEPGSSETLNAVVQGPAVAGDYWLGVCVNAVSAETLKSNNCSGFVMLPVHGVDAAGQSFKSAGAASQAPVLTVSNGADCSSLNPISCGERRLGTLGPSDCDSGPLGTGFSVDAFTLEGSSGDVLSLDADWTGLDGYLYLQSPSGEIIAENNDFDGTGNSRVERLLTESGAYEVILSAGERGSSGSYFLELACDEPSGPDLAVDSPTINSTLLRRGQSLNITGKVHNQGKETSTASSLHYFLGTSPELTGSELLLGETDLPSLISGGSVEESFQLPLDVEAGEYFAAVCAAADVQEFDTSNNCAVTGPLMVEASRPSIEINSGLNDAWFNPQTNGQGFFINVFPDDNKMFLSWFTFDTSRPVNGSSFELGEPGQRWLTAFGSFERGVASLDVVLSEGGVFDQSLPVPRDELYGSMTVSFSDCNTGLIEFDIPSAGEPSSIVIKRIASDNINICEEKSTISANQSLQSVDRQAGVEPVSDTAFEFNPGLIDAWYNPETNGQGFFINTFPQHGSAFVSWFTYDTQRPEIGVKSQLGEPGHRWLTAQGDFSGNRAEMTLYLVEGGVFNSNSPTPVESEYGSLVLQLDDCSRGEIEYDIPSVPLHGTIPIQRIASDRIPDCEKDLPRVDTRPLNSTPGPGDVLQNACDATAVWDFNWPDMAGVASYEVELWKPNAVSPLKFMVKESELRYVSEQFVPEHNRKAWHWRYRPWFSNPAAPLASFSPAYAFDVASCDPAS